jgi:uncharacterized membrane protein
VSRRPYLDWLRGIAVLIMIEGHTLDAWTRLDDRDGIVYRWAIIVAGFGAPVFLFLAGITLALAAGSRLRKGLGVREVARTAVRRGAWILFLGFLFRAQSWAISGGRLASLLKVDILNIMGVSMMAGAVLWWAGRTVGSRTAVFAIATAAVAMATPLVRDAAWLAVVPDPVEWYFRPPPGSTTFSLFPWMGFFTAGAAAGLWLDRARTPEGELRVHAVFAAAGVVIGLGGYAASFLPPLFERATFWGGSPTFFFLRLGVLLAAVPLAFALSQVWRGALLQEFGRASLFVYWIHVEMVYGVLSTPLHRALPLAGTWVAMILFGAFLFGLVRLKDRLLGGGRSPQSGTLAPQTS